MGKLYNANKLVRDNIPEIIKESGQHCEYIILNEDDLKKAIKNKIFEELDELINAKSREEKIEEIADLLEILEEFCNIENISYEEVLTKKEEKKNKKGSFKERKFLTVFEKE